MNKPLLPEDFTLTFHAGFMGTAANSVSSVSKAVEMDAQIVEMDVNFLPDGTPVTAHDLNPDGETQVLLEDMLREVAKHPSMKINLDLKSVDNVPEVDRLVKELKLEERAFYTGVGARWTETVKQNSTLPYYLNHGITPFEAWFTFAAKRAINTAKKLGAVGINSRWKFASRKFALLARKNGLLVSLWTPSTPESLASTLKTLPDNITTREPVLAREKLAEFTEKK